MVAYPPNFQSEQDPSISKYVKYVLRKKQRPLLENKEAFFRCTEHDENNHNLVAPCRHRRSRDGEIFSISNAQNIKMNPENKVDPRAEMKRRRSRRVCFQVDENDCPETDIHTYKKAPSKCLRDMHWTQEELLRMRRTFNEDAAMCRKTRHDIVESVQLLYSDWGSKEEEENAIRILTASGARGVERRVLGRLMRKERHQIIQQVLEMQVSLSQFGPDCRRMMLGKRCAELTEQSAKVAAKLASGDYLFASGLY